MLNSIIFPSSYFNCKRIDEDLAKEYKSANDCNLFSNIFLFSYDSWVHDGKLILDSQPKENMTAAYRGWMMQPEQYENFYFALKEKNIELITTPEEYSLFHIFPNIYEFIKNDTPRTILFPNETPIDLERIKKEFHRFLVKDYVKSVKGTDFPIYFDCDVSKDDFNYWINKFYEYRGKLFTGGFCIKEFVDLKQYDDYKNEYRVFYINGEIATINRNSGQPDYTPVPPIELIQKYSHLNSKFYTIDFAELYDGSWIIIEAGDGSVSGLSDYQDYNEFFRKLYYCFL